MDVSQTLCPESTPRRLVWRLPMRTLVDQAAGKVRGWVDRLQHADFDPDGMLPQANDVHVLMGGADSGRWFENPEGPTDRERPKSRQEIF